MEIVDQMTLKSQVQKRKSILYYVMKDNKENIVYKLNVNKFRHYNKYIYEK